MKEIQPPILAVLHNLKAAGGFLEHGQAGMHAGFHSGQVDADREFEGVVLHALRKSVARGEQAVRLHGNQAQIAGPCAERPVSIVGIVIPLPLRAELCAH